MIDAAGDERCSARTTPPSKLTYDLPTPAVKLPDFEASEAAEHYLCSTDDDVAKDADRVDPPIRDFAPLVRQVVRITR